METRYGFSKEIFYIIIDVFKKYSYAIEKVILFGSRARGDFKRTSDIDIAIKFKKNPEKIYADVATHIEKCIKEHNDKLSHEKHNIKEDIM